MGAPELGVAVRDDDQGGGPFDPAREQAHEVEGGLVGPVEVLEHDDAGRRTAQLGQERREDVAGAAAAVDDLGQLAAGLHRDVDDGPERARRLQRLAGPRHDAHPVQAAAERAQQGGLADPCFAADEQQPAAARRRDVGKGAGQQVELVAALEQRLRQPLGAVRCARPAPPLG